MRAVQELLTERDYRQVYPFVFGLVKILARKFNFLISESNTTLDSLKNPFAEDEVIEVGASKARRNAAPKRDGAFQGNAKARKNFIDLSNVKYHGLDQAVFDRIEEALRLDAQAHEQKQHHDVTFMKKEEDSIMQDID